MNTENSRKRQSGNSKAGAKRNRLRLATALGAVWLAAACAVSVEQRWNETRALDTIEGYRNFKRQYASSPFAAEASERIASLEADEAWAEAEAGGTADDYRRFLRVFNASDHAPEAAARIAKFEEEDRARKAAAQAAAAPVRAIEMTPGDGAMAAEDLLAAYEKENPVDPEMRRRMKEAEEEIKRGYAERMEPLEARRDELRRDVDARRKTGRDTQLKAADMRKEATELERKADELDNTSSGGFDDAGGYHKSGGAATFGSGGSGGMVSAADAKKLREQAGAIHVQAEDMEAEVRAQAEDYDHARGELKSVEDEIKELRKEQRQEIQRSWNSIRDEAALQDTPHIAPDGAAEAGGEAPVAEPAPAEPAPAEPAGGGLFD